MAISPGNKVSIEHTIRREDLCEIDTTVGSDPLTYIH